MRVTTDLLIGDVFRNAARAVPNSSLATDLETYLTQYNCPQILKGAAK